jgi:ATP-dependent DNA ligase
LRPLPEPMLARSGSLPTRGRWAYEVKWDGFRAIVRAGDDYRVRSRRGWDMTQLVRELQALPAGVYDGELVAFDDGIPRFPDVCARLLNGDRGIRLVYLVFDLLALEGRRTMALPYSERRRLLEQVAFRPEVAIVSDRFDDGPALFRCRAGARPRGRRREAPRLPLCARRARLGKDEEPQDVVAVRGRA